MPDPDIPESQPAPDSDESFADLLAQHERSRSRKPAEREKGLEGTVIAVSGESVILDIGFKIEGVLPLAALPRSRETVKAGDKLPVTIKGRNEDGYYELSLGRLGRPKDWASLEKAFTEQTAIAGTVTGVIKGGLNVDVGVRAFLPGSRSGAREAAEMEKLVGQEIRCRIIKLDVAREDVVVDRRVIAEEEERAALDQRYSEIKEGETVRGVVRRLTDYGAFIDIGGMDALLHVSDISWGRVNKPADVLSLGQQIEAKVLKVVKTDPGRWRISLGMKQLQPDPWELAAEKYRVGQRVRGAVTRLTDFGAFVELEPGVEGLIHVSEMSWSKKVKTPGDVVKPGDIVEAVILGVTPSDRRIALGLKQALGDPWVDAPQRFPAGSVIEGPVTNLTKFGAFVQVSESIEGMIHISEITDEKRINHPQEVLSVGQQVKAQVLEINSERRLLRLSMKQLIPTSLDEYIAEHKEGEVVTGRLTEVGGGFARVELGEGIQGSCRMIGEGPGGRVAETGSQPDLSSLSSMLNARWKGASVAGAKPDAVGAGQIRSFRIAKLDPVAKKIELELA